MSSDRVRESLLKLDDLWGVPFRREKHQIRLEQCFNLAHAVSLLLQTGLMGQRSKEHVGLLWQRWAPAQSIACIGQSEPRIAHPFDMPPVNKLCRSLSHPEYVLQEWAEEADSR